MASGNFVRGFGQTVPYIAQAVQTRKERKRKERDEEDQKKRRARIAAAVIAPTPANLPVAEPEYQLGIEPDVPANFGYDPEEIERYEIGQRVRTPKIQADLMEELGPGAAINFLKSLPSEVQPDFQRAWEDAKLAYALKGPEAVPQLMRGMIEAEMETPEEKINKDPLQRAQRDLLEQDPDLARRAARIRLGLEPRPSATAGKPEKLTSPGAVIDAWSGKRISTEDAQARLEKFREYGIGGMKGPGPDPNVVEKKLNTLQETLRAQLDKLELSVNQYISKDEWEDLDDKEKTTFQPTSNGMYWRKNPEIIAQQQEIYEQLADINALYSEAEKLAGGKGQPSGVDQMEFNVDPQSYEEANPQRLTPAQKAAILNEAGFTHRDGSPIKETDKKLDQYYLGFYNKLQVVQEDSSAVR